MIFPIFRTSTPGVFIFAATFFLVARIVGYFTLPDALEIGGLFAIFPYKIFVSGWLGFFASSLFIFSSLWFFNLSVNKNDLVTSKGFIPLFASCILFSAHQDWYVFSNQTIVLVLLAVIIYKVFSLSYPTTRHGTVFDTGLLIGISSLLYFPTIILLIWLYQTLLVLRNFSVREWVMPLFGFFLPYLYLWSYFFLIDAKGSFLPDGLAVFNFGFPPIFQNDLTWSIFIGLFILLIFISLPKYLRNIQLNKIRIRKSLSMLTWLLPYALIGIFLFKANVQYLMLVLSFPLSIILTVYFEKEPISNWAHYLSIALIIGFGIHLLSGFF